MLGLRGCRLGLVFPEINVMQTRAILEAARNVAKDGIKLQPKIMIPLVGHVNELREVRRQLEAVAKEIAGESGGQVDYKFGTMIELPRAALTAGQIAAGRRLLQLRHQRPDADDVWHEPRRRRGQVPAQVRRGAGGTRPGRAGQDPQDQPVPDARPRRRGPARSKSPSRRGGAPTRSWRSASAASMVAIPTASPSATRPAWTT